MRSYFVYDNETIEYEDTKSDLSYQELYKLYAPRKTVIVDELKALRARLYALMGERAAVRDRLALTVPYPDLELAVSLATVPWHTEQETLTRLIEMNQSLLRLIDGTYRADEVKAIPMTEFITFRRGWAICPFHTDTKPSLHYYKKDNRAHCFSGCGQKNVIQVYAVLNGLTTKEAFRQLSERLV